LESGHVSWKVDASLGLQLAKSHKAPQIATSGAQPSRLVALFTISPEVATSGVQESRLSESRHISWEAASSHKKETSSVLFSIVQVSFLHCRSIFYIAGAPESKYVSSRLNSSPRKILVLYYRNTGRFCTSQVRQTVDMSFREYICRLEISLFYITSLLATCLVCRRVDAFLGNRLVSSKVDESRLQLYFHSFPTSSCLHSSSFCYHAGLICTLRGLF